MQNGSSPQSGCADGQHTHCGHTTPGIMSVITEHIEGCESDVTVLAKQLRLGLWQWEAGDPATGTCNSGSKKNTWPWTKPPRQGSVVRCSEAGG